MSVSSMRGRLGLLLMAFVFLVSISVGATFWAIDTQAQDARVINLSGRQRMLIQQITRLAPLVALELDETDRLLLAESMQTFELTLDALQNGGSTPYIGSQKVTIQATQNEGARAQLTNVRTAWDSFHRSLERVLDSLPGTQNFERAVHGLEIQSDIVLGEVDLLVRLYELDASQKLNRLRSLQTGFFLASLALLLVGSWRANTALLRPLHQLVAWAGRIGSGDLDSDIELTGPDEVRYLGEAFRRMQMQLQVSRAEQVSWAETLERRVDQRTRELEALYDVSREISSRLDIQQVLDLVVQKASELLEAETASLCLADEAGEILEIHAHSGPREAIITDISLYPETQAGKVLAGRSALNCADEHWSGGCSILAPPFRVSHLAAPLWVGERVIGALCVGSPEGNAFGEESTAILTKLANAAAIALENARLYNQAEHLATLEERQRIAAEMHDGLGQTLSYLGLMIDAASEDMLQKNAHHAVDRLQHARQAIDQATDEVRHAITQLLEDVPLDRSLQEHLANLVKEFHGKGPARVIWEDRLEKPELLPQERLDQVLRVASEALTNAQSHAEAASIRLSLSGDHQSLVMTVEDNGRGFNLQSPGEEGRAHYGLPIMRARAAHIGGDLTIRSKPRQGTYIELRWPRAETMDDGLISERRKSN